MSYPHGTVLRPAVDRFADKIALTDNGCIEWTASTQGEGYGQFYRGECAPGDHGKIAAHRNSKTHCPADHPYAGPNLYVSPGGSRFCRTCKAAASRAYRARKAI